MGITGFIHRAAHDLGFIAIPLPQVPESSMGFVQHGLLEPACCQVLPASVLTSTA
jgi:hypothetical protein